MSIATHCLMESPQGVNPICLTSALATCKGGCESEEGLRAWGRGAP